MQATTQASQAAQAKATTTMTEDLSPPSVTLASQPMQMTGPQATTEDPSFPSVTPGSQPTQATGTQVTTQAAVTATDTSTQAGTQQSSSTNNLDACDTEAKTWAALSSTNGEESLTHAINDVAGVGASSESTNARNAKGSIQLPLVCLPLSGLSSR